MTQRTSTIRQLNPAASLSGTELLEASQSGESVKVVIDEIKDFIALSAKTIFQNIQSEDYTTVLSDSGNHILHPSSDGTGRTFTIASNDSVPYPIGSNITFVNQNGAGVITIAISDDTMRFAGPGTSGSRSLAANGIATALKIGATEWIIGGTGLS